MKVRVISVERDRHCDEEMLESYSLGTISEEEASQLEEHLLACEYCQRQLAETEDYVLSMRRAGARLRTEQRRARWSWVFPRFAPALATALAVLVVGLGVRLLLEKGPAPPVAVTLTATRGFSTAAQAPAGKALRLDPDLEGLPALAVYRLEMVDSAGRRVWQGDFEPGNTQRAAIAPAARPGLYFVRVYAPGGVLLREYALQTAARTR